MIPISEEAKSKYIKDSTPKNLRIAYAKKDMSEIANINMGLPVNHSIFDGGGMWNNFRVSPSNPYVYAVAKNATGIDVEKINGTSKILSVEFYVYTPSLIEEEFNDNPAWLLTYVNNDGETIWYRHYIPDASIYKNGSTSEPVRVNFDMPIPNGFVGFFAISLDCYTNQVSTHNESVYIAKLKFFYGSRNDYNSNNMVLLKDIPNFNPTPYNFTYITKDNIEEESFSITESLSSKDNLKYGLCEASVCEFTVVDYNGIEVGDLIYPEMWIDDVENSTIPLGFFVVHSIEISYEGVLEKKRITAYSKITNLENKATDWNTIYMYGINTYTEDGGYTGRGFEFARQMYSTVFSALKFFGIEDIRKHGLELLQETRWDKSPAIDNTRWIAWDWSAYHSRIQYISFTIDNPDTNSRYLVESGIGSEATLDTNASGYKTYVDSMYRGLNKANILVEEWSASSGLYHRTLVDGGDLFAISKSCTRLKVYIPYQCELKNASYTVIGTYQLAFSWIRLYKESNPERLTNSAERLMYYNYMSREIFPIDSSATGRDVVRSILEMCGCFFGLDRATGLPRFVYPDKAGLYPSDTLYPSDDLYPRSGVDDLFAGGKYISLRAENYTVASIGKIQIVKSEESNEVKSAVWEHVGSNAPNTYIIDDNIYYCAEDMEYDYDLMIDVSRVLVNMFFEITNTYFTPFKATAIGIPWEECGDRIAFETHHGDFETFIFRRKLKGIDALKDTFEAKSDKITEGVNTYLYTQEEE